MSSSTIYQRDHFICSQNHMRRLESPMIAIQNLFDDFLKGAYPQYSNIAVVQSLEGDVREDYGDYAFFGVVDLCNKLRKDDPFYFHKKGPMKIALEIKTAFESKVYDMMKQLCVYEAGILTFRLEGCWISKKINQMFPCGIDAWAPKFYPASAVFIFPTHMMNADLFRSLCIKDVLANIFVYSGVDVGNGAYDESVLSVVRDRYRFTDNREIRGSSRTYFRLKGLPNEFYTDVATFCYAFDKQRADFVVYMTPLRLREYIKQCHNAAAEEGLLRHEWDDVTQTCGFRTLYGKQLVSRGLYEEFKRGFYAYEDICRDAGYSMERFFECACKYACLKTERMLECTIKYEDFFAFHFILGARVSVSRILPEYSSESGHILSVLSDGYERELGLQLLEFTDAVNRAGGTLMPDILCEYIFNLSTLIWHYQYNQLNVMPGLCIASKMVMDKCFCLLGIDRDSLHSSWDEAFGSTRSSNIQFSSWDEAIGSTRSSNDSLHSSWDEAFGSWFEDRMPADFHIISSSARTEEHLNSRFEILSMNVEVAHSSFDIGSIYGDVSVLDTYLSRPDGWVRYDKDDTGYVSYFHREWFQPKDISNGSYISLEDPSSLHSIPFSTRIEVSVMVIATSKDKDETYLLANCKGIPNLEKFWSDDHKKLKYGTIKCYGRDGRILLDFVAIKQAVDTKMTLEVTKAVTDLRVYGKILAYYGDDDSRKKRGFLGQYHALIFEADPYHSIEIRSLPLLRSTLAVPADGKLYLKAHLTDADTDEDIVKETKDYCASPGSVSVWDIEGKRGSFKFSVNWLTSEVKSD